MKHIIPELQILLSFHFGTELYCFVHFYGNTNRIRISSLDSEMCGLGMHKAGTHVEWTFQQSILLSSSQLSQVSFLHSNCVLNT